MTDLASTKFNVWLAKEAERISLHRKRRQKVLSLFLLAVREKYRVWLGNNIAKSAYRTGIKTKQ